MDVSYREVQAILRRGTFSRRDIITLLSVREARTREAIRAAAEAVVLRERGSVVYRRGLVEFSNRCRNNCLYCGIRRDHRTLPRYTLSLAQILRAARRCARRGYGSMVLQAGERREASFVREVEAFVRTIKSQTRSKRLPQGLGLTLSLGEQSAQTYRRWFEAGAHRYLLRIETTNADLFARIHPPDQTLRRRLACLRTLQNLGYQVGTGVMIGLPGQTVEMLADDVMFFRSLDADMIGMGPYLEQAHTPMADWAAAPPLDRLRLSLLMIAVVRLVLPDVNIASTTALQALHPEGYLQGLRYGANVIMPRLTPPAASRLYHLYDGRAEVIGRGDHEAQIARWVRAVGRQLARDDWGDSPHFFRRRQSACAAPNGRSGR